MQKKNSSALSSSRFDKNKKPSSGTSWKREDSARPKKTTNKPQSSSSSSQTQPYKKQGLRGGTAAAQARAAARKFNPSDFIQKVEEQVVAAPYISKHSFSDFPIAEQLKINIAQKGYTQPTPIQDQAIPILLQERDIVATANINEGDIELQLFNILSNNISDELYFILLNISVEPAHTTITFSRSFSNLNCSISFFTLHKSSHLDIIFFILLHFAS